MPAAGLRGIEFVLGRTKVKRADADRRYGLAVEHVHKDLVVWSGERGKTFFFQSEMPYGVTQASLTACSFPPPPCSSMWCSASWCCLL